MTDHGLEKVCEIFFWPKIRKQCVSLRDFMFNCPIRIATEAVFSVPYSVRGEHAYQWVEFGLRVVMNKTRH